MAQAPQVFCSPAPEDAVSRVQFLNTPAPDGDLLVSSWDGTVRLYASETGQLISRCSVDSRPILSACSLNPVGYPSGTSGDGVRFVAGSLSGEVLLGDFTRHAGAPTILGAHTEPVRCTELGPSGQVFTGSWDTSVRAWDMRVKGETTRVAIGAKVFAMSISYKAEMLVVCDSQKTLPPAATAILTRLRRHFSQSQPVLKSQLRAVYCCPDGTGYCVSSVEGRVAWELFDPALGPTGEKKNYAFKCHRERTNLLEGGELIFPVNALAFHHHFESFATGGGDGVVITWDGYSKKRLAKVPETFSNSVSSLSFHPINPTLAIGLSDGKRDLAKPRVPGQVAIRFLKAEEVTPKARKL